MQKEFLLDKTDREIIFLLQENTELSQEEIAKKVGISQPSVGARINKLKAKGLISNIVGINFKKVGMYLAKVDISTNNTTEILNSFKNCPYFLNGFIISGRNNLCLFFVSEDLSTLEAIVDYHLRSSEYVNVVDFNLVISSLNDLILPIKSKIVKGDKVPCSSNCECKGCVNYENQRCLGCPATENYRGKFW